MESYGRNCSPVPDSVLQKSIFLQYDSPEECFFTDTGITCALPIDHPGFQAVLGLRVASPQHRGLSASTRVIMVAGIMIYCQRERLAIVNVIATARQ